MSIELIVFFTYFFVLFLVALGSSTKSTTEKEYVLGNRSLNFWLTALSAHASDMSSWLFLAYPALVFTGGFFQSWAAIGLVLCMWINWQIVAPRLRKLTEETSSLTLSSFFEKRIAHPTGSVRIVSALCCLVFYTIYISSGLVGLGLLVESLFHIDYWIGVCLGIAIVSSYVFFGGYTTVAWVDLFQGFFLLGVILLVPFFLLWGFPETRFFEAFSFSSLLPSFHFKNLWQVLSLALGWGLGYFGQPHILTKFMGVKNQKELIKSKYLGISWQVLSLLGATLLGLIGRQLFFSEQGFRAETIVLYIVTNKLSVFFGSLVLCAILAATTNVIAAQILVVASSIAEDLYPYLQKRKPSSKQTLHFSRISVLLISFLAFIIASSGSYTVYNLVLYAWSGLGCSFGPLLLVLLFRPFIPQKAALAGLIVGAITGVFWPAINAFFSLSIPATFVGFFLSLTVIFLVTTKSVPHEA